MAALSPSPPNLDIFLDFAPRGHMIPVPTACSVKLWLGFGVFGNQGRPGGWSADWLRVSPFFNLARGLP